jgi:hypothetical protein
MRFQQSPKTPQIVPSIEWLSLQEAARSALYPSSRQPERNQDEIPGRTGGRAQFRDTANTASRSDINLALIHERVFIGTTEDPGLLQLSFMYEGGDRSARPAVAPTADTLVPPADSGVPGDGRSPQDLGTVRGDLPQFHTFYPGGDFSARPPLSGVDVPGSDGRFYYQRPRGVGRALTELYSNILDRVGRMPSRRALAVADSLLPQVYQQTFTGVPLGYTDADVTATRTERWVEINNQIQELQQKQIDLEEEQSQTGDQTRVDEIANEISALRTEITDLSIEKATEEQKTGYSISPGRAYLDKWDRARQEFEQQVRADPYGYTPEMVRSAVTSLDYAQSLEKRNLPPAARRYGDPGEGLLVQTDVVMLLRNMSAGQRQALKQDLIAVDPSLDKDINSMTSIDAPTVGALTSIIAEAQANGQQWDLYLQELVASDRIRERGSGGGGRGFTIQLPAKEDVKQLVQAVAGQQLGMNIDDPTAEAISEQYINYFQTTFQSQMGASVVNEPMSAETFVTQQVQEQFSTDYDVYQMGGKLDVFRQMLGGQR